MSGSTISGAFASGGWVMTVMMLRLSTIMEDRIQFKDVTMGKLRNPHPGEILKEEFLNEIGMSQNQLAYAIGVPGNRMHAIVNETRDITADTDLAALQVFQPVGRLFSAATDRSRHA
jgi:addiction module HigA family antidote